MADTAQYYALLYEVYELIYHELERKDDANARFARKTTSQDILERGVLLNRFFQSLSLPAVSPAQLFGISESTFTIRIRQRHLYDFLATLIFARCSHNAAIAFVKSLVVPDELNAGLGALPADRHQLQLIFGRHEASSVDDFYTKQAIFCTVILQKSEEVVVKQSEMRRLPYIVEEPIGQGAYGKVSRVVVAKGHFVGWNAETENRIPKELAKKDYLTTDDYAKERETIRQIFRSTTGHQNILRSLGSIQVGQTYSLFMPLAECDLQAFMTKKFPEGPSSPREKADIIRCCIGLASGLEYLHNGIVRDDGRKMVCFHMDLKPSNVLVFIEKDGSRIWRLSDFGMSRVREVRDRGVAGDEAEKDFNRIFKRRQRDYTTPATINPRGEGIYLGPESIAGNARMNTRSDIWSLGCVLSDIFVYLEKGGRGVLEYPDLREGARGAKGYERFFVEGKFLTTASLNPAVKEQHRELIRYAHARNPTEGHAAKTFLKYLEKSVLDVNPKARDTAGTVMRQLQETYEEYNTLRDGSDGLHRPDGSRWGSRISSSDKKAKLLDKIESWPLGNAGEWRGCAISPSAKAVVYWTNTELRFYMPQPTLPQDGNLIPVAATHLLEAKLNQPDRRWRNISVHDKYLAASVENSGYFQCFIFDLQGPLGTPIGPNFLTQFELTMRAPEINHLVLSPNGKTIACTVKSERNDDASTFLYFASVRDLIEHARDHMNELMPATPSTNSSLSSTTSKPWSKVVIPWPSIDLTGLWFPSDDRITFIAQKERTYLSSENSVTVVSLSFQSTEEELRSISIVGPQNQSSRGQDRTHNVPLLTTWASFRHEPRCAIVTHEKELHISSFRDADGASPGQRRIEGYRIMKIVMDGKDELMFALGTETSKTSVFLLAIPTHQPSSQVIVYRLKILRGLQYGVECEMRLSEALATGQNTEAGRYVLIAALVSENKRAVYRVDLPSSGMPRGL